MPRTDGDVGSTGTKTVPTMTVIQFDQPGETAVVRTTTVVTVEVEEVGVEVSSAP
jgi:hypothetical protein